MTDVLKIKLGDVVVDVEMDDNGRYCLNDVFKGSGKSRNYMPSQWLRNAHTDTVVVRLEKDAILHTLPEDFESYVILTGKGRGSKTFAPLKQVYKYAGWISKEFEDAVYKAFTHFAKGEENEGRATISANTITPEIINKHDKLQAKLHEVIGKHVGTKPYHYSNFNNLICKCITGYTVKELTNGMTTAKDWIFMKEHQSAMLAKVNALQLVVNSISMGLDYHQTATMLCVQTGKNKDILKDLIIED